MIVSANKHEFNMTDYKSIFEEAEKTLKKQSWFSEMEFDGQYGHFKKIENKKRTNQEIFELLVMIIFYSGFRATTIEQKEKVILGHLSDYTRVALFNDNDLSRILGDTRMVRNKRKIGSCIFNAKTFKKIVEEHGSFQIYLDSFAANSSFENFVLLKEELQYRFDYLGGTTVYHFLTELGFQALKPDRVILRIFKRLGLIESEKQLLKSVILGRKFSKATEHPIRYIDIILVKYGQKGRSKKFGLADGICVEKNPRCKVCGLSKHCDYYRMSFNMLNG